MDDIPSVPLWQSRGLQLLLSLWTIQVSVLCHLQGRVQPLLKYKAGRFSHTGRVLITYSRSYDTYKCFPLKASERTTFHFDVRGSYDFISVLFPACSPLGEIYFQFVQCRDLSFCSTIITNYMMILKLLHFCFPVSLSVSQGRYHWK